MSLPPPPVVAAGAWDVRSELARGPVGVQRDGRLGSDSQGRAERALSQLSPRKLTEGVEDLHQPHSPGCLPVTLPIIRG